MGGMNWAHQRYNPCGPWEVGHDLIRLVRGHETRNFLSQPDNRKDVANAAWGAGETSSPQWEREWVVLGGDRHAGVPSVGC